MFLQNKYSKLYYKIIDRAKQRQQKTPLSYYTETHHILPKSLGGDNSSNNLIVLTARKHFIVHHLLTKFTIDNARSKMWIAYHFFFNGKNLNEHRNYKITARMYERVKLEISKVKQEMWEDSVLAQQFREQSNKTKQEILDWIVEHKYNFLNPDGTYTEINYRPSATENPQTKDQLYEDSLAQRLYGYRSSKREQHRQFVSNIYNVPTMDQLKIKEHCSNYINFIRQNNYPPRKATPLHTWFKMQATQEEKEIIDETLKRENILIIPNKVKNLTGKIFGKLIVIKFHGTKYMGNGSRASLWQCTCQCGNIIVAQYPSRLKSCGCVTTADRLAIYGNIDQALKEIIQNPLTPKFKPDHDLYNQYVYKLRSDKQFFQLVNTYKPDWI